MGSCVFKCWFFQNGCCCHGNEQNTKKLKNTKMIIAGYSPNRNCWNAYLVPLDVDVTGNITAQILKFGVILKMFVPWLSWQRSPFVWIPFIKLHDTL
jgi:hypothetical protein